MCWWYASYNNKILNLPSEEKVEANLAWWTIFQATWFDLGKSWWKWLENVWYINLKKKERQHDSVHGKCSLAAAIGILREVEGVCFSVLESLLSLVPKPMGSSKSKRWPSVSIFKQSKRVACDGEEHNFTKVEKIDAALDSLKCNTNVKQVQNTVKPWRL